jgi:hypothetical protein
MECFIDLHGHSRKANIFGYGCDTPSWNFAEAASKDGYYSKRSKDHTYADVC